MTSVTPPALLGEVALVTGGASGLGLAVARRFVAEGAKVAIFDVSADRLTAVKTGLGDSIVTIHGDVRLVADNERAVQQAVATFGNLSIFVGNAGIYDNRVTLPQIAPDDIGPAFDELFGINVKGYILGAKAAIKELEKSRGSIVFTSSVSGQFPGFGGFLYVTAKHAISALTRQLAVELAPLIRVNAVAPGYVPTNLAGLNTLGQMSKSPTLPDPKNFLLECVPTADDYTDLYVMLASRKTSTTLTGSVLLADGGSSIHRVQPRSN